jgi:hypothetical protein
MRPILRRANSEVNNKCQEAGRAALGRKDRGSVLQEAKKARRPDVAALSRSSSEWRRLLVAAMFEQVVKRAASPANQRSGAGAPLTSGNGANARANSRRRRYSQNHVSGRVTSPWLGVISSASHSHARCIARPRTVPSARDGLTTRTAIALRVAVACSVATFEIGARYSRLAARSDRFLGCSCPRLFVDSRRRNRRSTCLGERSRRFVHLFVLAREPGAQHHYSQKYCYETSSLLKCHYYTPPSSAVRNCSLTILEFPVRLEFCFGWQDACHWNSSV